MAALANRAFQYTATIPAGTPDTDPAYIPFALDGWEIERVDLEVPPGPTGQMGFYLANNGMPWIPRSGDQWIVWDDHQQSYPADDYPAAAGWGVYGYNYGTYDHSVIVRFHVNPTIYGADAPLALPVVTFVERDVKLPAPVTL